MIGLILGISEGKRILSLLNKYTDDILVSTATTYGGDLLKDYRYKVLNTKPLNIKELMDIMQQNKIELMVDASHPYANAVTQNLIKACRKLNVQYVRYERPGISDRFEQNITKVKNYMELYKELLRIDGTILNTTGSKNIEKFIKMELQNRIIHRVLPSVEAVTKCFTLGIKPEDIVAIKGPLSYELNLSFIKSYNAKAIILKDSGIQGGTEEKLKAAIYSGIKAFVIEREEISYEKVLSCEEELVKYIVNGLNLTK